MNVLSAFTDQKKIRPVYQFKRGNTFTSLRHPGVNAFKPAAFQSTNMLPKTDSMLLQTVSPSSSTSSTAEGHATPDSSNSTPSVPDNEDEDDAIFDFPSALDEFVEIKVMVASNSRTVPEAPKLARKRSKPKQNATPPVSPAKKKPPTTAGTTPSKPKSPINPHTKKRPVSTGPTAVLPCADQDEFDIFAFDPQPTSHLTHKRKPGPKSKPTMITSTSPSSSSSSSSRFNPTHYTANTYIPPMPAYHTNPVHLPLLHPSISIASLLNEPSPLQPHQAQPVEKKRKRNLVARLKTASGEKENKHLQEFDCLSDEDDLALEQQKSPPLLPLKTVIKDPSLSPEISYEETMQMQLDSLMKTEFGESQQPPAASTNTRPQYQPSNKLNVRVTFQKKQR